MIRRNTWILVGLFAVLLALVLVWNPTAEEGGSEQTPTATLAPIWSVSTEEIREILVENLSNETKIHLSRDEESGWIAVEPEMEQVDAARIERGASWIANPSPRAVIADQSELEIFGLVPPAYRIEIRLLSGESMTLLVGREAPTGGSRYAMVPDSNDVILFSLFGINEVLNLEEDLLPTPTPTQSVVPDTSPSPECTATPTPAAVEATSTPNPTATP